MSMLYAAALNALPVLWAVAIDGASRRRVGSVARRSCGGEPSLLPPPRMTARKARGRGVLARRALRQRRGVRDRWFVAIMFDGTPA